MGKSRKELALEEERDELCKLLFLEKDEWLRFRAHYDTVLTLEAEVERLEQERIRLAQNCDRMVDMAHQKTREVERLRAAILEKDEALDVAASVLASTGRPDAARMCRDAALYEGGNDEPAV
jgi:hypothetical protein